MLSNDAIQAIRAEARRYEDAQAVGVEALKRLQAEQGWVDDHGLHEVAELLGMSDAELEAVATFYNLIYRRPVGRHVIHACDSVSCWICGYDALLQALGEALGIGMGQTTEDGRFTLLPIVCLGACDRAPALIIDGELHGNVDPQQIGTLLAQYE